MRPLPVASPNGHFTRLPSRSKSAAGLADRPARSPAAHPNAGSAPSDLARIRPNATRQRHCQRQQHASSTRFRSKLPPDLARAAPETRWLLSVAVPSRQPHSRPSVGRAAPQIPAKDLRRLPTDPLPSVLPSLELPPSDSSRPFCVSWGTAARPSNERTGLQLLAQPVPSADPSYSTAALASPTPRRRGQILTLGGGSLRSGGAELILVARPPATRTSPSHPSQTRGPGKTCRRETVSPRSRWALPTAVPRRSPRHLTPRPTPRGGRCWPGVQGVRGTTARGCETSEPTFRLRAGRSLTPSR